MKKIYILMQNYEAGDEYNYDVPSAYPCFAYKTEEEAKEEKKRFEKLNKAFRDGGWYEDTLYCYYTIQECDLI